MKKNAYIFIAIFYSCCLSIGCQKLVNKSNNVQFRTSETDVCFDINSNDKCYSECLPIIVDTHKISSVVYESQRIVTTIPLEITTTDLKTIIGERTCEDNWRIKLSNINGSVSLEIQDSANAPGYYSSALILGILNDTRMNKGEPIKFTFVEAQKPNNVIHFIFKVDYLNPNDCTYFNVSDLPT